MQDDSGIYAEENRKLRAENTSLRARTTRLGTLVEDLQDKMKLRDIERDDSVDTIARMASQGGLIVHALNCAMQLTEALIAYMPEGTVLPESVSTCKHALDEAMQALGRMTGKEPAT